MRTIESSTRPAVTIVVPTWNSREFVTATLEAIAAQTYEHLTVRISDDASTDDTADICERFASGKPGWRVIRQPKNLGWMGNVNALLTEATGKYVHIAFHDDLPAPSYIERCIAALEADSEAVAAYTDFTRLWHEGSIEVCQHSPAAGATSVYQRMRSIALLEGYAWFPIHGVLRTATVKRIGPIGQTGHGEFSADWPWILKLSSAGSFVRVPQDLFTKAMRSTGVSLSWDHHTLRPWREVTASCLRVVWSSPLSFKERCLLSWATSTRLREETRAALKRRYMRTRGRLGSALRRVRSLPRAPH